MSFWSSTPGMDRVIDDLVSEPGALWKGPYLSVRLPFVTGTGGEPFPEVPLAFPAHRHQERAFARLRGAEKHSTLVATGTGSGKTESFLWPILDHCRANSGRPGIKAILVYPMNALATDQALRIAKAVHGTPSLRGKVRAGLYIGESAGQRHKRDAEMGPDSLITDRKTMQEDPPDILLTNYKMLDYLLIRPQDQRLWQHNTGDVLRFLVVDELHTFDGAQGTDLACLVRRLKKRLGVTPGTLCCVGTSATLGGADSGDRLRTYAEEVFGEPFSADAVITEERVSVDGFFGGVGADYLGTVERADADRLDPARYADPDAWLAEQARLWFSGTWPGGPGDPAWCLALADRLRRHALLKRLLEILADGPVAQSEVAARLGQSARVFLDPAVSGPALSSFLGLVSAARSGPDGTRPFLDVRVQLWQRELARMVAPIAARPKLRFSDDLTNELAQQHLPLIHCRDCGALGWATLQQRDKSDLYRCGLGAFYRAFFANDAMVRFLWPAAAVPEGHAHFRAAMHIALDALTLRRSYRGENGDFPPDDVEVVVTRSARMEGDRQVLVRDCPFCEARGALTILGFRAATLTSVYVDQLFASRFNDDKKLLAFSDSVQDAAHRAGFLAARTWRFNLRLAVQRVVRECEGETLDALPRRFSAWWRRPDGGMDPARYVTQFLAPDLEWWKEVDVLRESGSLEPDAKLRIDADHRIAYEIGQEFGHQARIGRSLPRTGCATVLVDPARLDAATEALLDPLRNEVAGLRGLDAERLRGFLLGALHRLRERGGIEHQEIPKPFLESAGANNYGYKLRPYLPSFGRTSRIPLFWTDGTSGPFDRLRSPTSSAVWAVRWVERCFGGLSPLIGEPGDVWAVVVGALVKAGILLETATPGGSVWGLDPKALFVTGEVERLRCRDCHHWLAVGKREVRAWDAVPCLTADCGGRYVPDPSSDHAWYRTLLGEGEVARVFAAEHTGLLTRQERETVETQFKARDGERLPWYPNLLSSTPTLEMGIDIGDLSSGILCSVPPSQASYLQRIGRCGRRDGNAFLLTLALANPHDQFFYAEPREMLAGRVEPPGVFLNAAAVLERQLAAYCLDCWNASGISPDAVPREIREVFPHLDDEGYERFPHNWLAFVEANRSSLFTTFCDLFAGHLKEGTRTHLRTFLDGDQGRKGSLAWQITDVLMGERKQREALERQREEIRKRLAQLRASKAKDKNHEETVEELKKELKALKDLIAAIDGTGTFQLLTDQGFLPNYAFPESPIRLRSVIWRRNTAPAPGERAYETRTFEYVRPAATALSELAPDNRFYAGGRQVVIDQVDVATAKTEDWRFCDSCSHSAPVREVASVDCPMCGSHVWGEASQVRTLLRLVQVFANTSDRDSRIRDDREDRQPRHYNRSTLLTLGSEERVGAWRLSGDELPFAFEYLTRATFRDVNFGSHADEGAKFSIAGRSEVRDGFRICKDCGKVQPAKAEAEGEVAKPPRHTLWCPSREEDAEASYEQAVYLYREFSSEALRILLPLAELGTARQLNSFVAAFQLGMKEKYGGEVDHIRTLLHTEPEKDGFLRRQYLVLYDTVPGGTGYLADLVRPAPGAPLGQLPLLDVVEKALVRLETCVCVSDPEKDGCYRCLFAYRNSRDMEETSRATAADLFARILALRDTLVPVESLSDVALTGLMDSVLEARFIEALRRSRVGEVELTVEKRMVRHTPGFRVVAGGRAWQVEPQRTLGPAQGLPIEVSIDFLLHPEDRGSALPIAVFLDGVQFHQRRAGYDQLQRMSLLASGGFDVWSLTWWDVDAVFHRDVAEPPCLLHPDRASLERALKAAKQPRAARWCTLGTWESLVGELAGAEHAVDWKGLGGWALAAQMVPGTPDAETWAESLASRAPERVADLVRTRPEHVRLSRPPTSRQQGFGLWATVDPKKRDELAAVVWLDDSPLARAGDSFRATWQGYLHAVHALRKLSNAWFVTSSPQDPELYLRIAELRAIPYARPGGWPGVAEEVLPEFRPLVARLETEGLPSPVVGLDLVDVHGHTVGLQGELAWEARRVAVVTRAGRAELGDAVAPDWKLFDLEDLLDDPEPLTAWLAGAR
jgi:DEAD/DEAH box helicase domain-containing protein